MRWWQTEGPTWHRRVEFHFSGSSSDLVLHDLSSTRSGIGLPQYSKQSGLQNGAQCAIGLLRIFITQLLVARFGMHVVNTSADVDRFAMLLDVIYNSLLSRLCASVDVCFVSEFAAPHSNVMRNNMSLNLIISFS